MLTLTVDLGSTFTKAILIDVDEERIVGRGVFPSTVHADITIGLNKALDKIAGWSSLSGKVDCRLACSSAAGGLRISAIGLVPELTGEAARQAALGAGGKIISAYSRKLTNDDIGHLERSNPDIVLLSGGTDGGDLQTVERNGRILSKSKIACPIIVACNREAAPIVEETLTNAGKTVVRTENVMPELGRLHLEPARQAIRKMFLKHIIRAKGLEKLKELIDVLMPTPSASLEAAQLLAGGTKREQGLGDLMVVEVGGATTNVYSIFGEPKLKANVIRKGMVEESIKRTVEGDLGVRVSALSLVRTAGTDHVLELTKPILTGNVEKIAGELTKDTGRIPATEQEIAFDAAITRLAVRLAVERHVGKIDEVHTPTGKYYFQTGKNFASLSHLLGSGGPIVHSHNPSIVLEEACQRDGQGSILKPMNPQKLVDSHYVLWSMGLLSKYYPDTALRMLKNSLTSV